MPGSKILIVEDEVIIARELEARITDLGHQVVHLAITGAEAIAKAVELKPDLALMDIRLKGEMDGIDAAAELRRRCSVPVVFLTAFTDEETLERAKLVEPLGFIVKPFTEQDLKANLQMALHKLQSEKELRAIANWFAASMDRTTDGVIATTGKEGTISFINRVAEHLTGWPKEEAIGKNVREVFSLVSRDAPNEVDDPVLRMVSTGAVTEVMGRPVVLVNRDGESHPIDYTGICLRNGEGLPNGMVLVFRDLRTAS